MALDLEVGKLLCIDYENSSGNRAESLKFIFDGGILTTGQIEAIRLQEDELDAFEFVSAETALVKLNPFLSRRLEQALEAKDLGQTFYLENQKLCSVPALHDKLV